MSADLARAVAAGDSHVALDAGAPRPAETTRPAWGKGGFRGSAVPGGGYSWSTDDAFVGLCLHPFAFSRVDDRRFHDPLGAGLNSWPASAHSVAIAGLRDWAQFEVLSRRDFAAFNAAAGTPGLAHGDDGTSVLTMEVDGRRYDVALAGCDGVDDLAAAWCGDFALSGDMCATLGGHFRQACAAAADHADAHRRRAAELAGG